MCVTVQWFWFHSGNVTIDIPQSTKYSRDSGDCSDSGVSSERSVFSESSDSINKQTVNIG